MCTMLGGLESATMPHPRPCELTQNEACDWRRYCFISICTIRSLKPSINKQPLLVMRLCVRNNHLRFSNQLQYFSFYIALWKDFIASDSNPSWILNHANANHSLRGFFPHWKKQLYTFCFRCFFPGMFWGWRGFVQAVHTHSQAETTSLSHW